MNVLSVVCALLSQCWNATDMLERSWKWSPCLEFWILYQRFGGQVDDFFRHLLAEIFGAISLCSFWKGRLNENHLSAVTGRGVDIYDWRKWKEHGRKWKETDRRIKTHERNVNRNEREMARTRQEMFLYLCIYFFNIHTYKLWPPWWPRSCIPNILSVRIWTWHGGTMKGYGYEQIMEGHENSAHERKLEGNEMHWNKVE